MLGCRLKNIPELFPTLRKEVSKGSTLKEYVIFNFSTNILLLKEDMQVVEYYSIEYY